MEKNFKSVSYKVHTATEKAVAIKDVLGTIIWLPKSQIIIEKNFVVAVSEWIAKEKNLPVMGAYKVEKTPETEVQEIKSTLEEETKMEKTENKKAAFAVKFIDEKTAIIITPKKEHKRNIYKQVKTHNYKLYFKGNTYTFSQVDIETGMVKDLEWIENSDGFENDNTDFEFTETETKVKEAVKHEFPVHAEYETIKACIENDVPVYLVGPAGSGKNHVLQQIAGEMFLDFYFTNSVQQEFKITGFIDAGGKFHETEFYRAFTQGGLFFLDELDASIPEVLVLLNAAIANRYFEFPIGKIDAHENFRVVAAGNTFGDGADEQYTGRLVLDQASLDRFVVIKFDYDRNIELALAKGNKELVDFVEEIRKSATTAGVRMTFSYRAIISVTKLEKVLDLNKVMQVAILKGLDADTARTIPVINFSNKYWQAFKAAQTF